MAQSSLTIFNSLEFCKQFVANRPLSLGNFKEPFITSCNIIKQTILGPPFAWYWNRAVTGFYCTAGVQDYKVGNWAASTAFPLNFFVIDTNGNSQKVTTAGTSGGSTPSWNAATSGTTTDGSVVWTNQGPIANSSSSFSYGWIETASAQDINQSPPKWFELSMKQNLGLETSQSRPLNIAAQYIDNNGTVTFRLSAAPDKAYPVSISLQQQSALLSSINGTWSPIPDSFSYIYQCGVLALMFMYTGDQQFNAMNQKFVSHLLGSAQGLDATSRNIFLGNWQAVTGQPVQNQLALQQGVQSRNFQ